MLTAYTYCAAIRTTSHRELFLYGVGIFMLLPSWHSFFPFCWSIRVESPSLYIWGVRRRVFLWVNVQLAGFLGVCGSPPTLAADMRRCLGTSKITPRVAR